MNTTSSSAGYAGWVKAYVVFFSNMVVDLIFIIGCCFRDYAIQRGCDFSVTCWKTMGRTLSSLLIYGAIQHIRFQAFNGSICTNEASLD